jgi:predicted RNase H-like nuclease (RuvC/YqgF family)
MSFAEKTEKIVDELIDEEYQNAIKKYGYDYNSLHEGYAILKEEIEEVDIEIEDLKRWLDDFWISIKNDRYYNDTEHCVEELEVCVENAIKELAQVGAVLRKMKHNL